jgi:hypothetical protein
MHRLTVGIGCAAIGLAGCAGPSVGKDESAATLRAVEVTAESDIVLPIDVYVFTPEQQSRIDSAGAALAADCMKRFGFAWPVEDQGSATTVNRRYGVVSAEVAKERGYHPVIDAEGEEHAEGRSSDTLKASPEALQAYGGKNPGRSGAGGQPIPEGGCKGEADRKLGLDRAQDPKQGKIGLLNINFSSFEKAQQQPEFRNAQQAWSACMNKEGYRYATFLTPVEKYASRVGGPSREEIATAKTDVRCKKESDLLTVLLRLETKIQQEFIEQNAEGFAEVKRAHEAVLKAADRALAR